MQKLPQLWENFTNSRVRKGHTLMITTEHEKNILLLHKLNWKLRKPIAFHHRVDMMYIIMSKKDGEFEDTKEVFGNCNSKKDRQNNGQKKKVKRTNNDLQNTTQKNNVEQHELY